MVAQFEATDTYSELNISSLQSQFENLLNLFNMSNMYPRSTE